MNKTELQELKELENNLLIEWKEHKIRGGFDTHALDITSIYGTLYFIVRHLNKSLTKKKK